LRWTKNRLFTNDCFDKNRLLHFSKSQYDIAERQSADTLAFSVCFRESHIPRLTRYFIQVHQSRAWCVSRACVFPHTHFVVVPHVTIRAGAAPCTRQL